MPRTQNSRPVIGRAASLQDRLRARPILLASHPLSEPANARPQVIPGLQPLRLDTRRDALLYVPKEYVEGRPLPLIVMCHGAGGDAHGGLLPMLPLADAAGLLLLATASRRATWDLIYERYGPDVAVLDHALAQTFARFQVDATRIAIGGFSDGASYALSLGLSNGDLFTHVIAFSPGFISQGAAVRHPAIYISHGTADAVLPIDVCSRSIVPRLERAGYAVRYHEFNGPHTVPPAIAREAVEWLLDSAKASSGT